MRDRILQDGRDGIKFLLTRRIGADAEEVDKVLRETGLQSWGTEDILRTIQDLVPRTLPANILVAELARRVREGIPSKPSPQLCAYNGEQGDNAKGKPSPNQVDPPPTPNGAEEGSAGT